MAKKQLTTEEKLQAALVPEEEQPYKVPENWCWVRLGGLAKVKGGKRVPKGSSLVDEKTNHPYIRVTDFQDMGIDISAIKYVDDGVFDKIKNYTIAQTDIYISIAGSIGKVGIIPEFLDGANLTENAAKITNIAGVEQKTLLWYLASETAQNQMISATISTTQPKLALFRIENISVPLPPLNEQSRIVTRIESLFAKLDEAKEKIQEVLGGAELRKAAILHQAFTGKLTEKWRKENGIVGDGWNDTSSAELFEYVTSGSRGWAQYYSDDGAIFFRMGNLDHGTIDLDMSDIQYVDLPDKAEGQRSRVKKGDILISITADVGMIACIKDDFEEAYINQHIALARPKGDNSSEFIAWYFVSDVGLRQLQRLQRGATKVGLTLKDIKSVNLKMPCLKEQQEVVLLVESMLTREESTKTACESTLDTIDTLKKSILARAFRGELGTNDPSEASAKELLRRILTT